MAYPIGQYVRNHSVTVAVANWGIAQTHAHNLNDGRQPTAGASSGYTPNIVHVDSAYVTIGGTNYAINPKVIAVTAVNATLVTFVVGPANTSLRDALVKLFGTVPTSLTFEMVTRWVHTCEMGATATGDETIGVLAAGTLPVELASPASSTLETIYVRVDGVDTNSGRADSPTGAFLTIQRACNDIMAMSPLYHDVLVRVGAGTFAGSWTLDGVDCRNGASVYIVGNAPTTPIANGTSVSGGAATFTFNGHASNLVRFTPDAAFPAAMDLLSIGRTLRVVNAAGTRATYGTIAQVATGVLAANQVIDFATDSVLVPGAPPAWMSAAGTTYNIINQAAADVTIVTGSVTIANVTKSAGAAGQATGSHTAKHNLIGNIRFNTGAIRIEGADRFSFHGCRFENGVYLFDIRDCSSTTNSVPGAGLSRYWPTSVWIALGYINDDASGTIAGTANAWLGAGWSSIGKGVYYTSCNGTVQGLVLGSQNPLGVYQNSDMAFTSSSYSTVGVNTRGCATFGYCRWETAGNQPALVAATGGQFTLSDYNSFMVRLGAVPDTIALNPVASTSGIILLTSGSFGSIILNVATRIDGHNSAGAAANTGNTAIKCENSTLYMAGGHSVDFYGEGGFLYMRDGSQGYWSGNRAMAAKGMATAPHLDWDIAQNSHCRSIDDITHADKDNTVGPLALVDWCSSWVHGRVEADVGAFVAGNGAGGGIDFGAVEVVRVSHGSKLVIAVPKINNTNVDAGARALIVERNSIFFGAACVGANSCYLLSSAGGAPGGNSVTVGVAVAFAAPNPLVAVILNDLPIAPGGTEQLCYYDIE